MDKDLWTKVYNPSKNLKLINIYKNIFYSYIFENFKLLVNLEIVDIKFF